MQKIILNGFIKEAILANAPRAALQLGQKLLKPISRRASKFLGRGVKGLEKSKWYRTPRQAAKAKAAREAARNPNIPWKKMKPWEKAYTGSAIPMNLLFAAPVVTAPIAGARKLMGKGPTTKQQLATSQDRIEAMRQAQRMYYGNPT